jgi:hypothetical protein
MPASVQWLYLGSWNGPSSLRWWWVTRLSTRSTTRSFNHSARHWKRPNCNILRAGSALAAARCRLGILVLIAPITMDGNRSSQYGCSTRPYVHSASTATMWHHGHLGRRPLQTKEILQSRRMATDLRL